MEVLVKRSIILSFSLLYLAGLSFSPVYAETWKDKVKRYAKPALKIAGGTAALAGTITCLAIAKGSYNVINELNRSKPTIIPMTSPLVIPFSLFELSLSMSAFAAMISSGIGAIGSAVLSGLAFKSAVNDLRQ